MNFNCAKRAFRFVAYLASTIYLAFPVVGSAHPEGRFEGAGE